VFSTCLFDTFASIYDINFWAIAPSKFRTLKERRKAAGLSVPVGMVGTVLGGSIPPLFITYGVPQTYVIQGGVVVIGALILLALAIPGLREDKELIERVLKRDEAKGEEESFFKIFRTAMRQKSFVAYLLTFMFFTGLSLSVAASLPFLVRYSLKMQAAVQAYLMLGFLLGGVASLFFWVKLANKINNNKKVMLIGAIIVTIITPMFFFVRSFPAIIIVFIIWGIGIGGFWVMLTPNLSDVIDEAVVKTGKHDEGVYLGIRQFFNRFAIVLQTLNFVIVQSLFGFQAGSETQSASAVTGIHISLGIVPVLFIVIALLIWWKMYDLTPEKIEINKAKLKELNL
jgi:Na+/melibiose symporter-like transporter